MNLILIMLGIGCCFFRSAAAYASDAFAGMAAGLRSGFLQRADFGQGVSERLFLEPAFFLYYSTPLQQLYLRPSVHLSYVWDQAEMPKGVRVEESDLYAGAGLALLWDWVVIPAFEGGAQVIHRTIELAASDPVSIDESLIGNKETILAYYLQGGLGVPFFKGRVVAEPFYRLRFVPQDQREKSAVGLDLSFQFL